jgi:hypothetical protein
VDFVSNSNLDIAKVRQIQGILKFAVENTIRILESEDKRLNQLLVDRCARFPLSAGKTQQVVQVITTIATILKSVRARLT